MNNYPTIHHKQLLRSAEGTSSDENTRKKRRRGNTASPEVISLNSTSNSPSSDEFEDVELNVVEVESDDSDEFEDVDLHGTVMTQQPTSGEEYLTFTIKPAEVEKKKRKVIGLEERNKRIELHRIYLVLMLIHGAIRNLWCNDKDISNSMKISCVDEDTMILINQDPKENCLTAVRSRRLLDGLKKIMLVYNSKFRIISQGLIRKDWHELSIPQSRTDKVDQIKFKKLLQNFRGSRDLSAQGFLILLRGLGLNARLVFSLQPPDYTIITPPPTCNNSSDARLPEKKPLPKTIRQKFLNEVKKSKKKQSSRLKDSSFPIFWVEVWDKYSKNWISIDPIVLKIIEVCPKRRKSIFEPPTSDLRNQLTYVIAYDKYGRVRDVTRRYSFTYNARTIRKRIEFRSPEDKNWYQRVLRACNLRKKPCSADIYEMKEFHERDLAEGMPNNSQAFKNHPLYALESQLRQNEIIYPKDDSSKCGTFRSKKSSTVIPVYKRSSIHKLRSARAWYLKGRVLKVGATALKVREAPEPEDNVRLYAEFQTQMYIPPAIIDGKIPKNEFGNIDIYTKTMIPENGELIPISDSHPIKLLIRAANLIDIDYAKAIVAFDFGGGSKRKRGPNASAREGGILIDKSFKEAMIVTLDYLAQEEEIERRKAMEASALHNWKYFLLKLRVQERLNRVHGKIQDEPEQDKSKSLLEDENQEEEGGFVVDEEHDEDVPAVVEDDTEGGFSVEDYKSDTMGGFIVESVEGEEYEEEEEEEEDENEDEEDKEGENEEHEEHDEDEEYKQGGFLIEKEDEIEGGFVVHQNDSHVTTPPYNRIDTHNNSSEGRLLTDCEQVAKSKGGFTIDQTSISSSTTPKNDSEYTNREQYKSESESQEPSQEDFGYSSMEESDIEFEFSD